MRIIEDSLSVEIVPLTEQSAKLVMSWRNDPQTLANSFNSEPKTWPEFFDEFLSAYCADPALPNFFIVHESRRVGFIRFRRLPNLIAGLRAADISINLAPSERGKGIARRALPYADQIARNAGIELLVADIKPTNVASQVSFEEAGYSYLHDYEFVSDTQRFPMKRFAKHLIQSTLIARPTKAIGPGHPCFIIAEAGSNWRMGTPDRDMKMAKALIDVAAEAGADAVKFQTYKPSTTYVPNAGQSDYLADNGIQESITDIFSDLAMPYEMLPELADYAVQQGIAFMSSPFSVDDFRAIDPFTGLHKIASYEISHVRLIEAIALSGKPCVLSTGASGLADIEWAVNYFQSLTTAGLCLMQCTARYPAPLNSLNLGAIPLLKSKFGLPTGLSDHSRDPITGPLAAVALGADLIEKHYTLDNRLPGPDHAFALTPNELKQMVKAIRDAEQVVGSSCKTVQPEEEELYWYARRGLQAIKDIRKGDVLTEGLNFDILRPGKQKRGAHPKIIDSVAGSRSTRDIPLGDGIQSGDFIRQSTEIQEHAHGARVE